MNPQRQRILLFLGGCVFIIAGTYIMIVGDTRAVSNAGAIVAGMGTIVNLAQLLFKFPLELPRKKSSQEHEIYLPPSYQRKKQQESVKIFLPASYSPPFKKRQKARPVPSLRRMVVQSVRPGMLLLLSLIPILGILSLAVDQTPSPPDSCLILTERVDNSEQVPREYIVAFTVHYKSKDSDLPLVDASYAGFYATPQAAQKELPHFLVGRSYPCGYVPTGVYLNSSILKLYSDIPLLFSQSRDEIS